MNFYLGTHKAHWLRLTSVPLFISVRTLRKLKRLPVALGPWAMDSGGFSELNMYGKWMTTPSEYVQDIRRAMEHCGNLQWCAAQDLMAEPFVIKKTGLSVKEHIKRTVDNFIELRSIAPDLPIVPTIQGFTLDEYLSCVDLYERSGVELRKEKLVSVGTMCRRQGTQEAHLILHALHKHGLKLHAFGFKKAGLMMSRRFIESSDSLAWSMDARKNQPVRCGGTHKKCANCITFALNWREKLLKDLAFADKQLDLFAAE